MKASSCCLLERPFQIDVISLLFSALGTCRFRDPATDNRRPASRRYHANVAANNNTNISTGPSPVILTETNPCRAGQKLTSAGLAGYV